MLTGSIKSAEKDIEPLPQRELSLSGESLAGLIRDTLSKGADFRFKVAGSSMSPFIKDKDIVTISSLSRVRPDIGRIAAFINPHTKKLAIHRIVDISGGRYLIKGDNVSRIDGFMCGDNILGCVTKIERNTRRAFLGLGSERLAIAFLSRTRLLSLLFRIWRSIPFPARRFIKSNG